jgi:putative addiction module component (TIGR02574 family)
MSSGDQKICIEALSLPRASRAELVHRLLASLEEELPDSHAEKTWKAEIRRRSREIHEGRAKTRPAVEVMRDALRAIS